MPMRNVRSKLYIGWVVILPTIVSIGHDEITDYLGLELGAYRYWTYCGDLCITAYNTPSLLTIGDTEWKEVLQLHLALNHYGVMVVAFSTTITP